MKKYVFMTLAALVIVLAGLFFYFSRPDVARVAEADLEGREPRFTTPRREMIPTVVIAKPVGWADGAAPVAANGLQVSRFASGLDHPRTIFRLPNGDLLVAETNSPPRPVTGLRDWITSKLMGSAGAGAPSANRITLLRDGDGDGVAEQRHIFLEGLNSPYGMALVDDTLYVANTDSLMAFPYKEGETRITAEGRRIASLPANAPKPAAIRAGAAKNEAPAADGPVNGGAE